MRMRIGERGGRDVGAAKGEKTNDGGESERES